MEGASAPLGPCCHLLAYCRQLFSAYTHRPAPARLLGVGTVSVCMAMRHSRYMCELPSAERTLQCGDLLFYRHGTECAGSLQATYRFCVYSSCDMDYSRGRLLYHRRPLLFIASKALYALRIPFLCPCRQRVSHHCRMGCVVGISVIFRSYRSSGVTGVTGVTGVQELQEFRHYLIMPSFCRRSFNFGRSTRTVRRKLVKLSFFVFTSVFFLRSLFEMYFS